MRKKKRRNVIGKKEKERPDRRGGRERRWRRGQEKPIRGEGRCEGKE